jgi:hypothetical protein
MAVPVAKHGTLNKTDWNRIQAVEVGYLRTVKGYTRTDQLRNWNMRNDLVIIPLYEKNIEYRNNCKTCLQRMKQNRIPLQAYKYRPSGSREIGRQRGRCKET